MTRAAKLLLMPVLLGQLGFFAFVARHRFIDGDEGAFLLSSRLAVGNQKPYVDFFYNQAPLLPYVYGPWMKVAGMSWSSGRMLCVLLTAVLGIILYDHVCRQTRSWSAGLAAVLLFTCSTLVFAWYTVVKTHCLAGLFLFSAYAALSRYSERSPRWPLAVGGLLFGLSVDSRSFVFLVAPLLLWWVFQNCGDQGRLASLFRFLGGFILGTLPSLLLFLSSPDRFLFDNLRYHGLRSSQGLIGWWQEKLVVFLQLFLGARDGNGLQWSILFLVSFGLAFSVPARGYLPRFAFQIAVLLMIIGLLPTPSYAQYFCLCVPFLIVSAVCGTSELLTHLESRRDRLLATAACLCVLAIYVGVSARDLRKYLITGDGVPGVQPALDRGDWKLQRVIEASQAIDQIARPGEVVASFWPGDIFQTKAAPFPGLENPFTLPVSDKLTAEQRLRYHIVTPTEIEGDFAAHRPRVVVLRNQILTAVTADELRRMQGLAASFRNSLVADGYIPVRSIGGISIYVCCVTP